MLTSVAEFLAVLTSGFIVVCRSEVSGSVSLPTTLFLNSSCMLLTINVEVDSDVI